MHWGERCVGETKRGRLVCDCALCTWWSPGYSLRERSVFSSSLQRKTSQCSTGESTSQSVPGLKVKTSPPPSQRWSSHTNTHTHGQGHACTQHMCSRAYTVYMGNACTHTCPGLVSLSLTRSFAPSALPLFIHGDPAADTISSYLSHISQLPVPLCRNSFPSSLTLRHKPSVNIFCLLHAVFGL